MSAAETWKAVPAWEGLYEVSDLGRVRSVERMMPHAAGVARYRSRIITAADNGNGYRFVWLHREGKRKKAYVHRLVALAFLGVDESAQVDHRDGIDEGDGLRNLRPSSPGQNNQNQGRRRDNTSGFKGVFRLPSGRFHAYINASRKRHSLGTFETAQEAAEARWAAAQKFHGEFARRA